MTETKPRSPAGASRPSARALGALVRIAVAVCLVVVVATAGLIVYLHTDGGADRLRSVLVEQAHRWVPGLRVGRLGGRYLSEIIIEDAELRDRFGGEAIAVDRIRVRWRPWRLLSRTVQVTSVEIERPRVLGRPLKSGFNLAELVRPSTASESAADTESAATPTKWRIKVQRVRLTGGRADFRFAPGQRYRARNIAIAGHAELGAHNEAWIETLQARAQLPDDREVDLSVVGRTLIIPLRLDARATLSAADPADPSRADITVDGPLDKLAVTARLALRERGSVEARGELGLLDTFSYKGELRLTHLDPQALLARLPHGDISLQATVGGRGVPLTPDSHARLQLAVSRSSGAGLRIDRASISGTTVGRKWKIEKAHIKRGANTLRASGQGDLQALSAKVTVDMPELEALALASGKLSGLRGALQLKASGSVTRSGRIRLQAHGSAKDVALRPLRARSLDFDITAKGPWDDPAGEISIAGEQLALGRGATMDRVRLHATGRRRDVNVELDLRAPQGYMALRARAITKQQRIETRLDALRMAWRGQTVSLRRPTRLTYRWRRDSVSLGPTELDLQGGHVSAHGDYRWGRRPRLNAEVAARALPLAILHAFDRRLDLHGSLDLSLSVQGPTDQPQVALKLQATEPQIAPIVRLAGDLPEIKGALSTQIVLNGSPGEPTGRLQLKLDHGTIDGRAIGPLALDMELSGSPTATKATCIGKVAGVTVLTAHGSAAAAAHRLLHSPRRVALQAKAQIAQFALQRLASALPALEQIKGNASADLSADGMLASPRIHATGKLSDLSFAGVRVGDLLADVDFHDGAARARLDLAGEVGKLHGKAQLDAPAQTIVAEAHAVDLKLKAFKPLLPSLKQIDGRLNLKLQARGRLPLPTITGTIRLQEGKLHATGQPTLEKVELLARLREGQIDIQKLSAHSGAGTLRAHGSLRLGGADRAKIALKVKLDAFRLGVDPVPDGTYTGQLRLDGTLRDEALSLQLTLDDTAIKVPEVKTSEALHTTDPQLRDVVFTDRRGREQRKSESTSWKRKLSQHLAAKASRVRVTGKQLDVEAYADVVVRSDSRGQHLLTGHGGIRKGQVSVLDRRYQIERARVRFRGQAPPNPTLDVEISRQFPDATVYVSVLGTAERPRLRFRAEPPRYDRSQILNLITTGRLDTRETDDRDTEGRTDLTSTITSAVSQAVLGGLAKKIIPGVAIDVTRISVEDVDDRGPGGSKRLVTAEFGKYVYRTVYLGYRAVTGADDDENKNEGVMELRISTAWFLRAVFGDAGVGGLDILWTHRY